MFDLGSRWVIHCIAITASLFLPVSADYFTNPPSFVTAQNGIGVKTQDLSTVFTIGQTVQITWATSIAHISLALAHWDINSGVVRTAFMTNELNTGFYTWTIGTNDNIDDAQLAISPNFEMRLSDPTGTNTSTGNPLGFVDHTLTSRGFVIKSNITSSSLISASATSTATASTVSTIAPTTSGVASPTPTDLPTTTASPTNSVLSTGAKIGIALGVAAAAAAIVIITALIFYFRLLYRRKQHDVQMRQATEIGGPDKESRGIWELGAPPNTQPQYGELSGSTSYRDVPSAELSAERHQ